ncbi:MAG: energy-coupling factor transporter transmembrane component T [Spirochaetota bacterium]
MNKNTTLHPITVIILFISLALPLFLFSSPLYVGAVFFIMIIALIRIDGIAKLKLTAFIFIFFFIVSLTVNFIFTNAGSTIIFQLRNIPIIGYKRLSLELIVFTLIATLRLVYIIVIFNFISYVSSEDRIMSFFSKFLRNFPLLLSFTIRLIPKLRNDYKRLEHIFKLRGFEFVKTDNTPDNKKKSRKFNLIKKIRETINPKFMAALIKTLLMNSLEDSLQYAEAMQARGFSGSSKRSSFFKESIKLIDFIIIFFSLLYFIYSIILFNINIGVKSIYPVLRMYSYTNVYELSALLGLVIINSLIFIVCIKAVLKKNN